MNEKELTQRGTPCAGSWDAEWVSVVEAKESELERRVCGARLMDGSPCPLVSNHSSGRCRYHGGFALTGAPEGNRNAIIHGLYSRRIKQCGTHCPLWNQCPCAGQDVLDLPQAARPMCPYEQTEYDTALTDAMASVEYLNPAPPPQTAHIAHTLALLQVMQTRAAQAISFTGFVESTHVSSENYTMDTPKVSPLLTAFTAISREYRLTARLLRQWSEPAKHPTLAEPGLPQADAVTAYERQMEHDTDLSPDGREAMRATPSPTKTVAQAYLNRAKQLAVQTQDVASHHAFAHAAQLDQDLAQERHEEILAAYRPPDEEAVLSQDTLRRLYGHALRIPYVTREDITEAGLWDDQWEDIKGEWEQDDTEEGDDCMRECAASFRQFLEGRLKDIETIENRLLSFEKKKVGKEN